MFLDCTRPVFLTAALGLLALCRTGDAFEQSLQKLFQLAQPDYFGQGKEQVFASLPSSIFLSFDIGSDTFWEEEEEEPDPPPPGPYFISTEGLTGNNKAVANYLNKQGLTSEGFIELSKLSGKPLRKAVNTISPARNAFGPFATQNTILAMGEMLTSHLSDQRFMHSKSTERPPTLYDNLTDDDEDCLLRKPRKRHNAIWGGSFAQYARQKKESQNRPFEFISEGGMLAYDYYIKRGFVGAGIGYAHTQVYEDISGKAMINSGYAGLYYTETYSRLYCELAVWGGYNLIHNKRKIRFPGVDTKAYAHIRGWQLAPHLGLGYNVDCYFGALEPFVAVDWAINWERDYEEHGASDFNMWQKNHTSSLFRAEAGLRLYKGWKFWLFSILMREKVGYAFKVPLGLGRVTAGLVGYSDSFTVDSLQESQNLGTVGLEILVHAYSRKRSPYFSFNYEGEFGRQYKAQEVFIKLTQEF